MMTDTVIADLTIDKSKWKRVQLGDVVEESREVVRDPVNERIERVVGLEHIDSESIHLRRWDTLEQSTTFTKKFTKGQVLFGRRRAYLKKAALSTFDGICSGDITVLQAKPDLIQELLPFLINNDKFFDYAVKNSAGSLSPRAKFKDLANYEFLLPPKDQQARLAELLWTADEVVESNEALKLKGRKILNALTFNRFKESNDPIVRIKDIATVQAGATPLRSEEKYFKNGSIPWLKTLDLNNGDIFETEEKITELAIKETSCKVREINSVLVAMYGGFNQIGRTGLLRIAAATNQAVSAIKVDQSLVRPEFLHFLLNAKVDYWKRVAISSRKDPNITKNDVENFSFHLPSLSKQDKIICEVKSANICISQLQAQIQVSKQLQKSIINQIF